MDEQDGQRSESPATPSDDGNRAQKRAIRRRSRRRRSRDTGAHPQTQPVDVAATVEESEPEQERPHTGNAAKPKRRYAQPRKPLPEFVESPHVVRSGATQIAPLQPMRMHKIDPENREEPMIGCPMLTRTRLGIPFRGGQRVPRCSKGWAVHDEDEMMLCMHTPTVAQCWKENPAQLEELVEQLRPIIEAELTAE